MAAGNTMEEAIVQGLSEVCERYALKEILLNKRIMPFRYFIFSFPNKESLSKIKRFLLFKQ